MKQPIPSRSNRVEWLWIGALTFLGACLRFWNFPHLGLTHFDEGIYASSGNWSLSPSGLSSLDPGVLSYAPPGFPILVGLAYALLGVSDRSAIFVSIAMGCLTIPLAGWLGRRLLGPGAGIASAAFASLALVHIAFSRKALTDVSFLATWLLAIGLGARFLERPGLLRSIAMGLAVGLAQNLKYNGWLVGLIVVVAALLGVIQDRSERTRARLARTFGLGIAGAFVAVLIYLPWFRFVDQHGGYSALLAHQRSYMGGLGSWFPHLMQQLAQSSALSGGVIWGVLKWSAALWGVAMVRRFQNDPGTATKPMTFGFMTPRILLLSIVLGGFGLLGLLASLVLFILNFWIPPSPRSGSFRLLSGWWLVLFVMTPFYFPYARLWLPLHALDWLLFAGLSVRLMEHQATPSWFSRFQLENLDLRWSALAAPILLILFWRGPESVLPRGLRPYSVRPFFEPTDALRSAVVKVAGPSERLLVPEGVSLRVLGRRPVVFYLGLLGRVPFRLLADRSEILNGPQPANEWLLIDEVQFDQEGNSEETWPLVLDRWRRVASFETPLDPVTLLDTHPEAAWGKEVETVPRLWLFAPAR